MINLKDTSEFKVADYIKTPKDAVEYLNLSLAEDNAEQFIKSLSDIAKSEGMTKIATKANIGRESLYKSLKQGAKPQFNTVYKILRAMNLRITLEN